MLAFCCTTFHALDRSIQKRIQPNETNNKPTFVTSSAHLHRDVIGSVYAFLSKRDVFCNAACVSRVWLTAVGTMARRNDSLHLRTNNAAVLHNPRLARHIDTLTTSYATIHTLGVAPRLAAIFAHLQTLHYQLNDDSPIDAAYNIHAMFPQTSLTHVHISLNRAIGEPSHSDTTTQGHTMTNELIASVSKMKYITHVWLNDLPHHEQFTLYTPLCNLHVLREFHLTHRIVMMMCTRYSEPQLNDLRALAPTLRVLKLAKCDYEQMIRLLSSPLNYRLVDLHMPLEFHAHTAPKSFANLSSNAPFLTHLQCWVGEYVTGFPHLPNLTHLELAYSNDFNKLLQLAHCTQLHTLVLTSSRTSLKSKNLCALLEQLPQLRDVSLFFVDGAMIDSLKFLETTGAQLHRFTLKGVSNAFLCSEKMYYLTSLTQLHFLCIRGGGPGKRNASGANPSGAMDPVLYELLVSVRPRVFLPLLETFVLGIHTTHIQ